MPTRGPRHRESLTSPVWEEQRRAFIAKLGREPGPDDPVLFDPDCDTPDARGEGLRTNGAAMLRAGRPEHFIYAYLRTDGLILTASAFKKASRVDRAAWNETETTICAGNDCSMSGDMDPDEEPQRVARMADTIARAALALPAAERADFIRTAVNGVRDGFRRECADDSKALEYSTGLADEIEDLASDDLRRLETTGRH